MQPENITSSNEQNVHIEYDATSYTKRILSVCRYQTTQLFDVLEATYNNVFKKKHG